MRFVDAILIFVVMLGFTAGGITALETPTTVELGTAKPVNVRFTIASFRVRNINNVRIYAVNAVALNRCNCKDCFRVQNQVPPKTCNDRSLLYLQRTVGCIKAVPNKPVLIEPGEYWILTTERINNVERPMWTTKRNVSVNGEVRL